MHYELIKLHGEGVEAAVYYSYRAGDEGGRVRDEILDCSAKFFGLPETLERSLADYVSSAFGERTVRVGQ